ncbi:TetR family transcriptional regulator [Cytophagaceae bacterium DM2B3-1]|uniref:TetR family transcriptional regulator n=1 Tax=Xanthocytophaga flava TaxID=3048013 RepID=A0ABT7CNN3_9BACT|nr:TetR family transcriptional regulator [Xanthocytophaga flavus]MDJ1473014.1 TetR family transcriptional regulator [Xanthocytophaga flavus]MDJ1495360.1 TetR family transcriptional regulator [Xanthocytophaga flavus]
MKETATAEERIKDAAQKVFLEKGFDGTTTRDIAKEAGVNSALMNYYFRSKEKLFCSVFSDMCQLFFQGMQDILTKPLELKEKIAEIIDHDFNMFKNNPDLSLFILNEIHRNPERVMEAIPIAKHIVHGIFEEQLRDAIARKEVRNVDVKSIFLMIIANTQFIFQCKAMHMHMWQVSEEEYYAFADKHKKLICDMIISYLFI